MLKQAGLFAGLCCALALATWAPGVDSRALAAADFPLGAYSAAGFTVTFGDNGQFTVKKGEEVLVEGEYEVEGEQLRLTDKRGSIACTAAGMETGVYKWKYESDALTLTKVQDACPGRTAAMTAQPWIRQK